MFADISFPISSFQVFSYKIPSELSAKILIGSTVNAPLGKRNVNGIVVNCYSEKKFRGTTKEINSLINEKNEEFVFEGRVNGTITFPKRGNMGFGYDPIFIPENHKITFGEMNPIEKELISHRAMAFKKLKENIIVK